ncbi:MAG: EAL domain-containing protein [Pseudomonadota bacterium]
MGYPDLHRRVGRAQVIALSVTAIVVLIGFTLLQAPTSRMGQGIDDVAISAGQIGLLQRSATEAEQLVRAAGPSDRRLAREQLSATRDLLVSAHTDLTREKPRSGLTARWPDSLDKVYFGPKAELDASLRQYVAVIDRLTAEVESEAIPSSVQRTLAEIEERAAGDLLLSLTLAATEHERLTTGQAKVVEIGQAFWAAILLTVLLLLGIFVFHPLVRSVERRTSDLVEATAKVEHASLHDMLTNLPNRRQCADELERAIASAKRNNGRVAILHIDLDGFKAINDTFGHAVGDAVLVSAARRFERSVRRGDTVARLGGDEFVIIAPIEAEPTEAARIATRILRKMSRPVQCGSQAVIAGASIGISIFPDDETDPERLLNNADIALYRAKDAGRGRVSFFSPDMRRDFEEREAVEADLRRAVANDEFEVHFQPQVRDDLDRVVGMEALVRWRHPERGMISAETFMPVAQSSGLIVPIGKRVIETALATARSWNEAGLSFGVMSINVSQQQIRDERFVEFLRDRMERHGIQPDHVAIEVVEAVLTDRRNDSVGKVIDQLQTLGVTVELDDFGTGYAALSHLKRYRINRLKIDKTFVGAIGTDTQNVKIIKTLVDVARNFEIDVLAEGVETEAQRRFLNALGCLQVQGYQVARPMDATAAAAWLNDRDRMAAADETDPEKKRDTDNTVRRIA